MSNRATAAVVLITLASVLTGCVGPAPVPTPTPSLTSVPPTTSAPEAQAPTPRFDLSCTDLGTSETLSALMVEPIASEDPIASTANSSEIPRNAYIEAVGGLMCTWSNGISPGIYASDPIRYSSEISIIPDAAEQWEKYVTTYAIADSSTAWCNPRACGLDHFVNGYWLSVLLDGPASEIQIPESGEYIVPAIAAFFDGLAAKVDALPSPTKAWVPPTSTRPMPSDCESIVAAAEVGALVGASAELVSGRPHGGWSPWAGARVDSGGGTCSWIDVNDYSIGGIAWLPAGAWAAERFFTGAPSLSPVEVANLRSDDEAYLRCTDEGRCFVDMIVGGNWIQVRTETSKDSPLTMTLSPQDAAVTIAATIAAHLYA